MEPRGLDFLRPIWYFMQTRNDRRDQNIMYIGLAPDQVHVHYTKYVNDFKSELNPLRPGQTSIRDAITDQLTPGRLFTNYQLNLMFTLLSRQC